MLRFSSAVETGYAQAILETYLLRPKRHLVWSPDLPALMEYGKEHPDKSKHALECAGTVLTVLDILEDDDPAFREYAISLLRTLALRLLSEADGRCNHKEQSRVEEAAHEQR